MTLIDPKITRFSGAPIRRKQALKESIQQLSDETPQDLLELRKSDPALRPEEPKKKSLGRRILEKGISSVMLASSIVGALGGIGIATNHKVLTEALNQEQTVYVFGQKTKAGEGAGSDPGTTAKQSNAPRTIDVTPESTDLSLLGENVKLDAQGLTASIGAEKTQAFVNHFRQSDQVQGKLSSQLRQAEGTINQALKTIEIPSGEALLVAKVPFPSGDGSILQVGNVNLEVGLKKLAMEELPLVLNYQLDPVDTGLEAKLKTVDVDQATLPGGVQHGVHLGSVRAEVGHAGENNIPLKGRVVVRLDDGAATRRTLEKTSDPAQREALEARLAQIERLQKLSKDQGLQSVLDLLTANHEIKFSGQLQSKGARVADGLVHAWLTPDHDQDQRADVRLSGELYTAALDGIEFKAESLQHSREGQQSGITGYVQEKMAAAIETGALQSVPKVMDAVRGIVNQKIQERFRQELSKVETQVDSTFDKTLDAAQSSGSSIGLGIERLDVDAKTGTLVAELESSESLLPKITIGGAKKVEAPAATTTAAQVSADGPRTVQVIGNSTVQVDYSKPSVVIPGSSARRFLGELLKKPEVREAFQTLTADARAQVEKTAGRIEGPSGSVGIEVDVPFPTQKNVNSPIGPLPELGHKTIPFQADYQIQDFGVALKLEVTPVEVTEAVQPKEAQGHGVFIGAVRVGTQPMTTAVQGAVQLHKGQTTGGADWAEKALNEAFQDQNFGFKSNVSVGETESLFYIWVVPDNTGDGKADVAVAYRSVKTGAENLSVKVESVDREGNKADTDSLGGKLHGVVGSVISDQLTQAGDKMGGMVSEILQSRVKQFLGDGSSQMSEQINAHLGTFYSQVGNLDIPVPAGMNVPNGKLSLKLGDVKVVGDSIVSEYGNERTEQLLANYSVKSSETDGQVVAPGELRAHVPGIVLNRLLADTSAGGPLDWNALLKSATKDSSSVRSLELAKDANGKTISPSLRVINGKPTLTIQLDGETNGLGTPVSAGARLLPGFVGDGLGWLSDNTVGAVLGSRLQTEVQVPLSFGVENGTLAVKAGDVKFKTPDKKVKFNIVDILPTRLLSSVIVDGIANAVGPDSVNAMLAKQNMKADLNEVGLQWTRVDVKGREGEVPNLTVGVTLGAKLPGMVGEKAAEMRKQGEVINRVAKQPMPQAERRS